MERTREEIIQDTLGYVVRSCRTQYNFEDFVLHRILREYVLEHGARNNEEAEEIISEVSKRYMLIVKDKDELKKFYTQTVATKKPSGGSCDCEDDKSC